MFAIPNSEDRTHSVMLLILAPLCLTRHESRITDEPFAAHTCRTNAAGFVTPVSSFILALGSAPQSLQAHLAIWMRLDARAQPVSARAWLRV